MKKSELRQIIREEISKVRLNEQLTPMQQYIYDFEKEVSYEDAAEEELEFIKKLNTIEDVEKYYSSRRGWDTDKDLAPMLKNLIRNLRKKFVAMPSSVWDEQKVKELGSKLGSSTKFTGKTKGIFPEVGEQGAYFQINSGKKSNELLMQLKCFTPGKRESSVQSTEEYNACTAKAKKYFAQNSDVFNEYSNIIEVYPQLYKIIL